MTLEEQLAKLAEHGITLNEGITIDDLLYSFGRNVYESEPFKVLLSMLGAEVERAPWGRAICSRVWTFDTECIYQTGDYARIVKRLCVMAGQPDLISNIEDFVDLDAETAWLRYMIDGREQTWSLEVNDDWADTLTLVQIMADIEREGYRFYAKNAGQTMTLYYLDAAIAAEINAISNNILQPITPV